MSLTKVSYSMIQGAPFNVLDFGATGDGVTNDTAALQAAITAAAGKSLYIPAGTYIVTTKLTSNAAIDVFGDGFSSVIKSNGILHTLEFTASNVFVRNLKLEANSASSAGGIKLNATGMKTVLIENVFFNKVGPAVNIFTCNDVVVQNCIFDTTGYGVLQEAGYVSSNVIVNGCIARNLTADFVEANCTNTAPSQNWTISNNIYLGNASYPTPETEGRFVGITSVKNVIISSNQIEKVAGDAAIHLEDSLGETIIDGNTFDNIVTSGGNSGYIYILNNAERTIISNNIFKRTNASLAKAYVVDVSSNTYSQEFTFIGNRVVGESIFGNLGGLRFFAGSSPKLITNNIFESLTDCISGSVFPSTISIVGNVFNSCAKCIYSDGVFDSAGGGGSNIFVEANSFSSSHDYNVVLGVNQSGTNPCDQITLIGNVFDKEVVINGNATNRNTNTSILNNVFTSTATYTGDTTPTNQVYFSNVFAGQNVGSVPGSYANDAAAASASVPIGGLYRNGSVVQIRVT